MLFWWVTFCRILGRETSNVKMGGERERERERERETERERQRQRSTTDLLAVCASGISGQSYCNFLTAE